MQKRTKNEPRAWEIFFQCVAESLRRVPTVGPNRRSQVADKCLEFRRGPTLVWFLEISKIQKINRKGHQLADKAIN